MPNYNRAQLDPRSMGFMKALRQLFREYGLCIVPTYNGEVSFHDSMEVVPFEESESQFLLQTRIAEAAPDDSLPSSGN